MSDSDLVEPQPKRYTVVGVTYNAAIVIGLITALLRGGEAPSDAGAISEKRFSSLEAKIVKLEQQLEDRIVLSERVAALKATIDLLLKLDSRRLKED